MWHMLLKSGGTKTRVISANASRSILAFLLGIIVKREGIKQFVILITKNIYHMKKHPGKNRLLKI